MGAVTNAELLKALKSIEELDEAGLPIDQYLAGLIRRIEAEPEVLAEGWIYSNHDFTGADVRINLDEAPPNARRVRIVPVEEK